jgi:hypothetical protein
MLTLGLVAVFGSQVDAAGSESAKEETKATHLFGNHECPVMGEPVDPKSFVEYKDEENMVFGRLYTCCKGCNKKTEAKAADLYKRYFLTDAKTGKPKEALDLANSECPISGEAVDEVARIEFNGMKLGFCCEKCVEAFLKDPNATLAKLVPEKVAKKYEYEYSGSGSSK